MLRILGKTPLREKTDQRIESSAEYQFVQHP